ncbi:MAG: hypothetical protein AABO58_12505 [Acidobacteriota bacterium]
MVPLSMLCLPILLSAVFIFIAANVLWMMLPFWHRKDYERLPDEATVLGALASARSGQYAVPMMDWKNTTPEQRAAAQKGPMASLILRNPSAFSFPKTLILYFVYLLVVCTVVAYLTGITLGPGTDYMRVFRVAGTAGILAFSFNSIADSIWYGKPWPVTFKTIIDGVIFGLLIAGTFGWLWPR